MEKHLQKNHSYHIKVDVYTDNFADVYLAWDFISAGLLLLAETTTASEIIEFSFDGIHTHGDLSPGVGSAGLVFDSRHESGVFLRRKVAGAPVTVRVDAWA
jgi:hypothetical protein